jgi:hypothetical protein
VRGTFPAPSDESVPVFSGFLVLLPCRRRKLWRLGAKIVASSCADLPTFFSCTCAECIRATWIVHGTRVRDCESFRAFGVWSRLLDLERARPATRPAATARWQVDW